MAEYDQDNQRLTVKLVYYGPAQSGKTTNLTFLHQSANPQMKGELMVLETKGDRTLFFDMLPMGMRAASGLLIKLKLFTVPGQVAHDSTRKAVLSRADGLVFVADSQRTQSRNNLESFENLMANLSRVGLDVETLPLVVQFNKRDMDAIVTEQEVLQRWEKTPWPIVFASALRGEGVGETFRALLEKVYGSLNAQYQLQEAHGVTVAEFVTQLLSATPLAKD